MYVCERVSGRERERARVCGRTVPLCEGWSKRQAYLRRCVRACVCERQAYFQGSAKKNTFKLGQGNTREKTFVQTRAGTENLKALTGAGKHILNREGEDLWKHIVAKETHCS